MVEHDLKAGLLSEQGFSSDNLFVQAEMLAKNHTAQIGSRSLDILHVAAATLLNAEEFVTFDQRQGALAAQVGLIVSS